MFSQLANGWLPGVIVYALAAFVGAMVGTLVGLRFMSQQATRYVLALILAVGGTRMLITVLQPP